MKTFRIAFRGGFHNSPETFVKVNEQAYNAIDEMSIGEWAEYYLTPSQQRRLENHFCGIGGCTCGSYARAEYEKL